MGRSISGVWLVINQTVVQDGNEGFAVIGRTTIESDDNLFWETRSADAGDLGVDLAKAFGVDENASAYYGTLGPGMRDFADRDPLPERVGGRVGSNLKEC